MGNETGVATTLAGGARSFCAGDREALRLPLAALDDADLIRVGSAFGALFLVPGIGETLRVNGQVSAIEDDTAIISVSECYGHCAKALIRSDFWTADPIDISYATPVAFTLASRFIAFATVDADGQADLSPKGDPAGLMVRFDGEELWFADRQGNRRVDSFRNMITQPRVAATLLVPGSSQILSVRGVAKMTTDAAIRALFLVKDKTPLLAIGIAIDQLDLRESPALRRAGLWPVTEADETIDAAKMFVGHVKLNRDKGLTAKVASAVLSVPGLMKSGLAKDYESNLY
nr:pyridoxamine 5'-phosphate oxidase family protein [Sphingobium xanthum]